MRNPRLKYYHDPEYHNLVRTMVDYIISARCTPSEMREASILACIIYEEEYISRYVKVVPDEIKESLEKIERWIKE